MFDKRSKVYQTIMYNLMKFGITFHFNFENYINLNKYVYELSQPHDNCCSNQVFYNN